jgi:hypothetical protein
LTLARYTGTVALVVAGTLGAAWPALDGARPAVGYGAALAAANTLAAYVLASWSFGRSNTVFLGAVLGGMAFRMGLMLLAVAAGIALLDLPKAPLAVSVLSYFVVFLILELAVLHRQTSAPRVAR